MGLLIVLLLTVLVLGLWLGSNYKELTDEQKGIEPGWKALCDQLASRYEILPEFAQFKSETSGGPALYDKLTEKLEDCKSKTSEPVEKRAEAERELQAALAKYLHDIERGSNLTEKEEYLSVRDRLLVIEDKVTVSRDAYNDLSALFNARQKVFPTSLIAQKMGIKTVPMFDVENTFADLPLKFKLVLPEKTRSIFMPEPKESK